MDGLKQTEMAREMGLAVRLYQDLEGGKKPIRQRHVNSAERVSLHFAVVKKNPMIARPSIRQEALELVDMIRGNSRVSASGGTSGKFQVIEIELGSYGEMISRKSVSGAFSSRNDAFVLAERTAKSHQAASGYNDEQGYWWGRDLQGQVYRFIVEAI